MSFKETWQNILTKIDTRIPIKKITSPLDKKYPLTSFFLFILIILVVLYLIFGSSLGSLQSSNADITIRLADNENNILNNFDFKIRNLTDGTTNNYTTNENGSFNITLDKKKLYLFIVEKDGYEYFEQDIIFDRQTFNFIIGILNIPSTFPKIIYFEDAYTNLKIKDALNVTVVCDNGLVITPSSTQTTDGSVSLEVPSSCNALYANVTSDKYNATSIPIKISDSIIKLNPTQVSLDVGSIYVSLMSQDLYIEDSITLKLFSTDDPVNSIKTIQSNFGVASFDSIPVGDYIVKANDIQNRYLVSQEDVIVTKNEMSEITINMVDTGDGTTPIIDPDTNQEIILSEITVFIKDKDTGLVLDQNSSPVVTLLLDGNQNIEDRQLHEGFVFNIDTNKEYSLKATAEGYIPGNIIPVLNTQSTYIFNLEKITVSNVSKIIVSITDEDDKPIVGIKSWIYDADGQYIDPRFDFSISDENGNSIFNNIPDLNFTIKVKNLYIEEISSSYHNAPPEDTNVTLPVVIGKGTINLIIKNKLEEIVGNSTVTYYSETGEVLGTSMASADGTLENQIKADKKVFLKIESDGYLPYFTEMFRIYKNKTITKNVVLERSLLTDDISLEYLGLYNTDDQKVESLKNNQVFYLKYKIIMPTSTNSFNFTLRAGSEVNVSDDIVFIMPENNSLGVAVYYDSEPFTSSSNYLESKLVNIQVNNFPASVHEITIPIRIRNAEINDKVSFFYTSSIEPINYMTHEYTQVQYFVEATSLCNSIFCFSGQYVDVSEGLRYDLGSNKNIPMLVNSDYILEYQITNSSQNTYPQARLSVTNVNNDGAPTSMVSIKSYNVSGEFSSVGDTATGDANFKIPYYDDELIKDNLNPFSNINFNLELFPLILGQSKLQTRLVSDQSVIYTLPITFVVSDLDKMIIDYEPKNIVPGVPFTLTVNVKDISGLPVEGANINLLQKTTTTNVTVSTGKTTDVEGNVTINLPALRPGETFILEAIKSKYSAEPLEFSITKDVLDVLSNDQIINDITPLEVFIHKTNIDGELYTLELKNKTSYPLTLKQFNEQDVSFNKSYLLNLSQTINYLNNQITNTPEGFIIPANESKELVIKFAPSESAKSHSNSEDILGALTGTYLLNNQDYLFNIPVKVKLSVGNGVLQDDCLVVTNGLSDWTTVVANTQQTTSLTIRNTCLSKEGGTPIAIKNVQAKIKSQGDRFGVYFLKIIGAGSASQVQLSENYYRIVINEMQPEEEYTVEVTYNTNGTKFAEVKTDLYLNAQIETEEGLVFVNKSSSEVFLKANISVMDLTNCFSYYDEGKKVNSGGLFILNGIDAKDLVIKNECSGKATFKMDLCEGQDYSCRDLTIENTDEENGILNFAINDSEKTVSIKRKDSTTAPGAYVLNNKVSIVNNAGREVTSAYALLRINAKDPNGLWMEDPFIEINDTNKVSEIVRLYNNDLQTTPWDYVDSVPTAQDVEKYKADVALNGVAVTSTFSDYLSTSFNKNDDALQKMNYKSIEDLKFMATTDDAALPVGAAIAISAVAAVAVTAAVSAAVTTATVAATAAAGAGVFAGAAPLLSVLAAIPVYGWIAAAVIIAVIMVSSWKNEFDYPILENKYLDVEPKYTTPNGEFLKTITVEDVSDSPSYLNVFDITGARYYTYNDLITRTKDSDKSYNKIKDRLTKDADLTLADYTLCKTPNYEISSDSGSIIVNRNCSNSFNPTIEDGVLSQTIKCYGKKPTRNRIQLKTEMFYTCKANEALWPEQAAVKPLQFNLTNEMYTQLNSDSKKYYFKNYNFNPTLEDSVEIQDPAFVGSNSIGNYRFSFFLTKPEETPNYDLTIQDCVTDTGKSGKTGVGAVPNVSLDWDWSVNDIDKCTDTYCDATQLTQVVLNRINAAEQFISSRIVTCPLTPEDQISQAMNGSYYIKSAQPNGIENNVSISKTGIDSVEFSTSENKFISKIYLDNRTESTQTGNIIAKLNNEYPTAAYYRNADGDLIGVTDSLALIPVTLNVSEDDTFSEIILEFSESSTEPIIGEDLSFNINFSGDAVDTQNNSFESSISLDILELTPITDCKAPATTVNYNGISYLDMWFNKKMYPDNVTGNGWSQEDVIDFKKLIEFDVLLVTDKYNQNFIDDFDIAFGGLASKEEGSGSGNYAIMSSPTVFNDGYLSPLLKNNLIFTKQYSNIYNNTNITSPGKYKIKIDFIFNNSSWKFTNSLDEVDLNAYVTLRFLQSPETDSVFYRMPFNGFVGQTNSGYNRQGYGVSYTGDIINVDGDNVKSDYDNGSNALRNINITKANDVHRVNSSLETRGNVLSVKYNSDNIDLILSQSKAIPLLMEVTKNNTNPLNVYYRLLDSSENALVDSTSLFRWTGVGSGCDFSGNSVFNMTYYDRYASIDGPQSSYILDWSQVIKTGKINLRTIFYAPEKETFTLQNKSDQGVGVKFSLNGTNYDSTINLGSEQSTSEINSIKDVFDLIEQNKICVLNSTDGTSSEFFYNPSEIYPEKFIEEPINALKCS